MTVHRSHQFNQQKAGMKRLQITGPVRARSVASISIFAFAIAGCGGGGGGSDAAPSSGVASGVAADSSTTVASDVAAAPTSQQVQPAPSVVAAPAATTSAPATTTSVPAATSPAPAASASLTAPIATTARDLAFYKLGAAATVGTATLNGNVLALDGNQFADTTLVAGACTIGGGVFSQCSSVVSQPTFILCGGSAVAKIRSRYVLFDPNAVRITDAAALQNRSFDGFDNCGQDNVGSQPKGAPGSLLKFDGGSNLTVTRYDRSPARTDTLPASLLNLTGETRNGGNTATLALYRTNGRYLIIATTAPSAGPTAADPGTLTAFLER